MSLFIFYCILFDYQISLRRLFKKIWYYPINCKIWLCETVDVQLTVNNIFRRLHLTFSVPVHPIFSGILLCYLPAVLSSHLSVSDSHCKHELSSFLLSIVKFFFSFASRLLLLPPRCLSAPACFPSFLHICQTITTSIPPPHWFFSPASVHLFSLPSISALTLSWGFPSLPLFISFAGSLETVTTSIVLSFPFLPPYIHRQSPNMPPHPRPLTRACLLWGLRRH